MTEQRTRRRSCAVPARCPGVRRHADRSQPAHRPAGRAVRRRRSGTRSRISTGNIRDAGAVPGLTGPLDADTKESIYSSYRRGIAVDTLAKRFQRTRTSMYRVINEIRAQRLLEQPLDYIPHPSFDDAANWRPRSWPRCRTPRSTRPSGARCRCPRTCRPSWRRFTRCRLLTRTQEQHLFRKMNFLKYKAGKLRDEFRKDGEPPTSIRHACRTRLSKEIEDLPSEANDVKDLLINANMRLVVNIAKRHSGQTDNFFELLSDGNMSLIRAVEKFDFGRGFKFSTYASWAIMKNFARSIPDEKHRRERFVTGHEEVFECAPDNRTDEHEVLATPGAGDAQRQPAAGVPRAARARDHPHAGRPRRPRRRA